MHIELDIVALDITMLYVDTMTMSKCISQMLCNTNSFLYGKDRVVRWLQKLFKVRPFDKFHFNEWESTGLGDTEIENAYNIWIRQLIDLLQLFHLIAEVAIVLVRHIFGQNRCWQKLYS